MDFQTWMALLGFVGVCLMLSSIAYEYKGMETMLKVIAAGFVLVVSSAIAVGIVSITKLIGQHT